MTTDSNEKNNNKIGKKKFIGKRLDFTAAQRRFELTSINLKKKIKNQKMKRSKIQSTNFQKQIVDQVKLRIFNFI